MPKYFEWTVGCQMNKADSIELANLLDARGYERTLQVDAADLIFLNSCSVRQNAENRIVGKLGEMVSLKRKRPDARLILTGCMVGDDTAELLPKRFPFVDLFLKPADVEGFRDFLDEGDALEIPTKPRSMGVSSFVNVIRGCDKFCTYCIVPYRRGPERSRPLEEILDEVEELVRQGTAEINLLGQTVDSYGKDFPGGRPDLADVFEAIHDVAGLKRNRFMTSYPTDMSPRIIRAVADLPKVCEHVHVPCQAGDDAVLRAMHRTYTADDYRDLVARIRATIRNVAISSDVIVGFPGETDEQFRHTYELLEELRLDTVHVACYSVRPGTEASTTLPDDVPLETKKARLRQIESLQERVLADINGKLVGQRVDVLVEDDASKINHSGQPQWRGRTRQNKLVYFPADSVDLRGQEVAVRIDRASPWALQG
ncbi:MAG: tRNA (N6-isopentenyl adenosine(37)-C2)-methylthiotransferase MiaB, partial [Chloroflexota bacterium]|nr:tRNA (N6-isopentenyl adenosine(37)-C2)-methylthiotransferase MiaB [Chloroflexota bacterium]